MDIRIPFRLSLLAAAALLGTAAQAQSRSTLVALPASPTTLFSAGMAINDHGLATGYQQLDGGLVQPWTLASDGTWQILASASGAVPRAINGRGEVAGSTLDLGYPRAARWAPATGWVPMYGTEALGINERGDIVGDDPGGGWLWTESAGRQDFAVGIGGFRPRAINDGGVLVGSTDLSATESRAAAWRNGQLTVLSGRGTGSGATSVSANGLAAGWWSEGNGVRAALWDTQTGSFRDLGTLGGIYGLARGVNSAGQVVGDSDYAGAGGSAFLWRDGTGMVDLSQLTGPELRMAAAYGINRHAQVVGQARGSATGGKSVAAVLTLHPDWQGGNGAWNDGLHWNWAGTGVAAAVVGAMHDVRIAPTGSGTVQGAAEGVVRTLQIGGTFGRSATLDLAGGRTLATGIDNGTGRSVTIAAGGVLRGSGQLEAPGRVAVDTGGRIEVAGGQRLTLAAGFVQNGGQVRAQGTAAAPAVLELNGSFDNLSGARVQLTQAEARFGGYTGNAGQIVLQDAQADFSAAGYGALSNLSGGQLLASFGRSTVAGTVYNDGQVIVSNGAEVSFLDAIVNRGELRISAGGAANFFGEVSGGGLVSGSGEARFEGGLSFGNSPGLVTVNPNTTIGAASRVRMELGGTVPGFGDDRHDKIVFNGSVRLEGGPLDVVWWGGFAGQAGQSFDLFDWNGALSGTFGARNLPGLASGLVWQTGDLYQGGTIAIAAVPEPGTWALWLAGLAGLGRLTRRRYRGA